MHASPNDAPVTRAACADPGSQVGPGCDPSNELAFRRSLRASRARRATAALRRRRTLRGRRSLLGAAAGLAMLSAGALASTAGEGTATSGLSKQTIKAAQSELGVSADGVVGPQTRRATRRFQRSNELEVDGVLGPQTLQALGVSVRSSQKSATEAPPPMLEKIAQCESGGDPTAISADGLYRGKYQFDRSTWRTVGGKGDPAAAPEEEQDRRAARLLRRSGTTPWPNCA